MRHKNLDVAISTAVALLYCIPMLLGITGPVISALGVALFAAPGYIWAEVLIGQRMMGLLRAVVAAGLTLALPVLGGVLLYAARIPLRRPAWIGLLVGMVLVGDLILFFQRFASASIPPRGPAKKRNVPIRHIAAFGAAVIIGVGAVALAHFGAEAQHYPGFTQLWLSTRSKGTQTVSLGVSNYQGSTTHYRLVLLRKGRVRATWNLMLGNGQTWQRTILSAGRYPIAANLYRMPDLARPYRHVALVRQHQSVR